MRHQPELRESLLDRLMDDEPELAAEPKLGARGNFDLVIRSLLRDLENLLNTRKSCSRGISDDLHAAASILNYGSSDFSSENPRSHRVRQQIRMEILNLLALFEPRLKDVTVRLDPVQKERTLHFRIEGLLMVHPVSVPTAFDTCFDINSGAFSILE